MCKYKLFFIKLYLNYLFYKSEFNIKTIIIYKLRINYKE